MDRKFFSKNYRASLEQSVQLLKLHRNISNKTRRRRNQLGYIMLFLKKNRHISTYINRIFFKFFFKFCSLHSWGHILSKFIYKTRPLFSSSFQNYTSPDLFFENKPHLDSLYFINNTIIKHKILRRAYLFYFILFFIFKLKLGVFNTSSSSHRR